MFLKISFIFTLLFFINKSKCTIHVLIGGESCSCQDLHVAYEQFVKWIHYRLQVIAPNGSHNFNVFKTCDTNEIAGVFLRLGVNNSTNFITTFRVPEETQALAKLLKIRIFETSSLGDSLVTAARKTVSAIGWGRNVGLMAFNNTVMVNKFFDSELENFCVWNGFNEENPVVVIGNNSEIDGFIKMTSASKLLIIPLYGCIFRDTPIGSFTLQPPYVPNVNETQLTLSPLLLQFATPVYRIIENVDTDITATNLLDFLQLQPLKDEFVYNIFETNQYGLQEKIGDYHIIDQTLKFTVKPDNRKTKTEQTCVRPKNILRNELWVLATLTVSTIGIVLCSAVVVYMAVRKYKGDVFEGNPATSIMLLAALKITYSAITPFVLTNLKGLCEARSIAATIPYCLCFSLMLSRCIMLATLSKDPLASHLNGYIQATLCIFIFAVQVAFVPQLIDNCSTMFVGNTMLSFISYSTALLGLLFTLVPFVFRSKRNYNEGRYLGLTTILLVLWWPVWITPYFLLANESLRHAFICLGLLGTASIILGTVFVPRTYLMTGAAVRDSLASALPPLSTYDHQHVYDSVDFTAAAPATNTMCPNLYTEDPSSPPRSETGQGKLTKF